MSFHCEIANNVIKLQTIFDFQFKGQNAMPVKMRCAIPSHSVLPRKQYEYFFRALIR